MLTYSVHIYMNSSLQGKLNIPKSQEQKRLKTKTSTIAVQKNKILDEKPWLLTWIKLSFFAQVFLDFYIRNLDFWLQRECQKYREIRWLSTLKRFFIVDGTGKKCPQSIIEVFRFKRFIYSKSRSVGLASVQNREVSTLERCPHTEVLLYSLWLCNRS